MRDVQGIIKELVNHKRKYEKKRGKHYKSLFGYLSKWNKSRRERSRKEHMKWGRKQKHSNCGKKQSEHVHEIWPESKSLKKFKDQSLEKERSIAKSRRVQWVWRWEYCLISWGGNNELRRPCRTEIILCKKTPWLTIQKDGDVHVHLSWRQWRKSHMNRTQARKDLALKEKIDIYRFVKVE